MSYQFNCTNSNPQPEKCGVPFSCCRKSVISEAVCFYVVRFLKNINIQYAKLGAFSLQKKALLQSSKITRVILGDEPIKNFRFSNSDSPIKNKFTTQTFYYTYFSELSKNIYRNSKT